MRSRGYEVGKVGGKDEVMRMPEAKLTPWDSGKEASLKPRPAPPHLRHMYSALEASILSHLSTLDACIQEERKECYEGTLKIIVNFISHLKASILFMGAVNFNVYLGGICELTKKVHRIIRKSPSRQILESD